MAHQHIVLQTILFAIITILAISLATNKWTVISNQILSANQGVWQACGQVQLNIKTGNIDIDGKKCVSTSDSAFTPIKILTVLGLVLVVFGLLLSNYHIYSNISIILGGICALIAAIIWSTNKKLKPDGTNYGYSWYLQLIGGILAIITGLFTQIYIV